MSDDEKTKDKYVINAIHGLLADNSISDYVANIVIDILEDNQEHAKILHSLEDQVKDIQKSLNDPDAHRRI